MILRTTRIFKKRINFAQFAVFFKSSFKFSSVVVVFYICPQLDLVLVIEMARTESITIAGSYETEYQYCFVGTRFSTTLPNASNHFRTTRCFLRFLYTTSFVMIPSILNTELTPYCHSSGL